MRRLRMIRGMAVPRYAVFGHPVAHSRSPRIHALFAAQTGIVLEYVRIDVEPMWFRARLALFGQAGGRGANVTLPLKQLARQFCNGFSAQAMRAGAVNTLARTPVGWYGHNTDGIGLVRDLQQRHAITLRGARLLVLGAGGAAAGILPALLDAGIAGLCLANRDPARAQALAAQQRDARVDAARLSQVPHLGRRFDVVINATSAARDGALPPLPGHLHGTTVVDLGYGAETRTWLQQAREAGCAVAIDGLGMLVEQAAESFLLWHRVRPATDAVYASLRGEIDPTADPPA